ncbi:adenine phosphoribosyltransferase [Candidatus Aerophobetes bacterium]|uniref:Adenine phosphoribosyltransferase n=1 Tax=Aerophobetes bacterium TaxID=2030807 RepID=A0A2A4YFN6_UNCAE|nr:MAG: adenine phosphoribosyltransferase [Candidatus Aerophobetes bacterium]
MPVQEGNEWVREFLTITPDFPKKGIMFISYERLLRSPDDFHRVIEGFAERYKDKNLDAVVGLDARGFIFGSALAYELNVPFVMVRKGGKLPGKTECVEYALEYGKSVFELGCNSLENGEKVVIIDDLLATGGTMSAACELVEKVGAVVVETACFLEISFLKGREKIGRPFFAYLDDR